MRFEEFEYKRIDLEKTKAVLEQLVEKLENEKDGDTFLEIFKQLQKVNEEKNAMMTLAGVRHSIDTNDEFYTKENDWWDEISPLLQVYDSRIDKAVLAFKDRDKLLEYIPETYFKMAECAVKSFDESIVSLLQKENKLISEYGKLKAGAQIEYDGKIYNLSSISPLLQSSDRNIRKAAYDAKMKFYKDNQNQFDSIYDEMVKVRTEMAKTLGYKNFTELGYYRMMRLDYNQDMVANYRKQILEYLVPLNNELYQKQAKRLGLDKLAYYDLGYEFETGNPTPKGSSDDLVKAAINMYHQMSKETGEFIDMMDKQNLWDLLSKDGKEMGGYTVSIPVYNVPFIFANFNGTSGDVDVLTHEAGHAFQYFMSRNIPLEACQWPTMESAEIHSMSMEFFAYPWMEDFFKEDTMKYYYSHLSGTLFFLPYGVLVDHFQHEVYNNPDMTIAERKATWRKLEKMYCPQKDFEGCDILEEGTWWYQQGHIFQSPFYYIDYTLAQVCALQFWARSYKKDPNAFTDYLNLCRLGGTKTFTKLVESANLIVPFNDGCVESIVKEAKQFLNSIDDSKL